MSSRSISGRQPGGIGRGEGGVRVLTMGEKETLAKNTGLG